MRKNVHTGSVHPMAVIGMPPEHRDWKDGDPCHEPQISSTAKVGAFVTIDAGLERSTRVGHRTFIMKTCHLGHDVVVGDDCELAPGTVLGGHVEVGNKVRFGINCCVRPFIKIGDGARIGAGAVVVSNVPPGKVYVGNPAREMGSNPTSPDYLKRLADRVEALES